MTSPFLSSNHRNNVLFETTSLTSKQTLSNDLHDIFHILKRTPNHQDLSRTNWPSPTYIIEKHTIINTPVFSQHQLSPFSHDEKQEFNNMAYCIAYCTIILMGISLGGWLGGLFEFLTNGFNGCSNEHRGHTKCQLQYASPNVTVRCVNIFYKNLTLINSAFICLCRFRNSPQRKYRDCAYLYADIRSF
ncbi:unnamed protein product [Adineta ricciae]|uniref:Uncharacterized protein n=1 Tax=Adineta ricciae TaxID=249248 RepID=A0A814PZ30_ADIRI|nr:unnamed protein product [Adineta ricciae]CAF1112532.1 unnamed protein product [Adineta ricciae]